MFSMIAKMRSHNEAAFNNFTLLEIEYALKLMQQADITRVDIRLAKQYVMHHEPNSPLADTDILPRYMELQRDTLMDWNAHHWWKCICKTFHKLLQLYTPNTNTTCCFLLLEPAMVHAVQRTLKTFQETVTRLAYNGIPAETLFSEHDKHHALFDEVDSLGILLQGTRRMTLRQYQNDSTRDTSPRQMAGMSSVGPAVYTYLESFHKVFHETLPMSVAHSSTTAINRAIHRAASLLTVFVSLLYHRDQADASRRFPESTDITDALYQFVMDWHGRDSTSPNLIQSVRAYTHSNALTPETALSVLQNPVYCPCVTDQGYQFGDTNEERYVIVHFLKQWMCQRFLDETETQNDTVVIG